LTRGFVRESSRRKQVKKQDYIARFFRALVAGGGTMTRAGLSVGIFSRNRNAARLDEFLRAPILLGLIKETTERCRMDTKQTRRYILTPEGWEKARAWSMPTGDRLSLEEVQRQFGMLAQDGCPWAVGLEQEAKSWRAYSEEQKQIREEKRRKLAEKAAAKKAKEDAELVKHPSAGRKRSQKDIDDRKAWLSAKLREWHAEPARPAEPAPVLPVRSIPAVQPQTYRPPAVQPQTYRPPVVPDTPRLDSQTLALIRKISAAGYQHCIGSDGRVLYNNTERLSPQEWVKRMPGIID
jgi:hypothetical protein